jgi:tetratricopeptide (TPR) repeat protein
MQEANQELNDSVNEAESFYLSQDYEMSAHAYDGLCNRYPDNPYILINAGNSHYHLKNYGLALSKYYKAKSVVPRNKELNNNLNIILNEIKLSQPPLLSYAWLNLTEALLIFIVTNILFLSRKRLTQSNVKRLIITACFVTAGFNLAFMAWEQKLQKHAVVTAISTKAYSGDNEGYTELFELLNGQIVTVLREEYEWSKIKNGNKLGWVKNEYLESI